MGIEMTDLEDAKGIAGAAGKPQFSGNGTNIALGELCEILNGYAFKSKRYVDEGIRVIRIANVQKGYLEDSHPCFYPATEKGSIAQFLLYENDLLLSLTGNVGRVALLDNKFLPAALNQRVACLRIKDESLLNKRYLFHCLNSMCFENRCIESANGIAQKNLSTVWLRGYAIPVPQMDKQLEIARRFDLIQAQISRAKAQIVKLDVLVKSRFIEMFGDITEQYLLGERLETTSGGTPSRKHPEYYEGGSIPWLTSGEVNKGKIDTPDHFITEAGLRNSSAKLVPANSVVVAMYGATAGQVGLVTYETTTNQAVCCIKPNACVAPVFLRYALEFKKDWMIDQCAGGAQPNISQGIVKKVAIPDVTLARQQEFADFASQVDKLRFDVQQQIDKLELLKNSLMQEYFG